jgi:multidrug transporter EmrE-like cation transporter
MNKLLIGALYGVFAQILTFLQLQGGIKYDWNKKYPFLIYLVSVPISYLFIKSVGNIVSAYDGELWPSRLIGFVIGVFVFSLMSYYLFKEPFTPKTIVCIGLGLTIIALQIFWK